MDKYQQKGVDFLKKHSIEFKVEFLRHAPYFEDKAEADARDIYQITLKRGEREYSFTFGNSIVNSVKWFIYDPKGTIKTNDDTIAKKYPKGVKIKNEEFQEPTAYDIFSGLQKYPIESFEDFCSEFGYDLDSRKAEKIYNAVVEEYTNVERLFDEKELEELREIN